MREIQNINFKELFAELLITVKNIKQITGSEDTQQAIHALSGSLTEFQGILTNFNRRSESIAIHTESTLKYSSSTMKNLDAAVEPLLEDVQQTLANTDRTLEQFQLNAMSVGEAFNEDAQLQQNLNSTLIEIRRSAKSIRFLADYIQRHPESIIQGKR
jgi:paraquat-inducible protein B